jgi:hypothetical protein
MRIGVKMTDSALGNNQMTKARNISAQEAQQLLNTSGCQKDEELARITRLPIFQLSDGRMLIYFPFDVMGVLFETREDVLSVIRESERPALRLKKSSDE